MRVLMLGWEFPPFITGGLGTACYGLTRALDDQGVEVLFVLPGRTDPEAVSHLRLVSPDMQSPRPETISPEDTSNTEEVVSDHQAPEPSADVVVPTVTRRVNGPNSRTPASSGFPLRSRTRISNPPMTGSSDCRAWSIVRDPASSSRPPNSRRPRASDPAVPKRIIDGDLISRISNWRN